MVEKRLRLVEEIRVTKRRIRDTTSKRVTLRRAEAVVERLDPGRQGRRLARPTCPAPGWAGHDPAHRGLQMASTVIGTFDDQKIARKVIDELAKAGLQRRDIEILEGEGDELLDVIVGRGFAKADARIYVKAVSQGKTLLATRVPEEKIDRAVEIIERFEGQSEEQGSGQGSSEAAARRGRGGAGDQQEQGRPRRGARHHRGERAAAIEETVTLREEQVEVERKPADRKLKAEEADAAFEERTIEMTETGEELEVGKEARVVEEVTLEAGRGAQGDGARHRPPLRGRGGADRRGLEEGPLTAALVFRRG